MTEKWVPVKGYEGLYSVSNMGRVRGENRIISQNDGTLRHWKGRILTANCPKITGKGRRYPSVALNKDGIPVKVRVHKLVSEHFLGPRPKGTEVLHWDDDPTNCAASNLRYGTHAENGKDSARNKPSCRFGHEWTPETTYIRPDTGLRQCRPCSKRRKQEGAVK